jgi:hypothetical protein
MKPIECSGDVGGFGEAIVASFAEAGAAEVKAKDGKAESEVDTVEDFHGVIDDFVVESAAAEWVRMTDESGVAGVRSAFVEEGFQTAGGAAEVHVFERGGVGRSGWFRGSYGGLHSKINFTRF